MPKKLIDVAQLAMDNYYQTYKSQEDFFDLPDFVDMVGNAVSAIYLQFFREKYAMIRQDRNPELVSFDVGWLLEQELEVKKGNNDRLIATLKHPVMVFPYDTNSAGIQFVFVSEPYSDDEVERASMASLWQLKYIPKVNKIFFTPQVTVINDCDAAGSGTLLIVNKSNCNVKKVRVLYVPVLGNDGEAFVPDGIIEDAVFKTVMGMKQMATGQVIDMTANGNPNKNLQSEIDKTTVIR